jgi:hypothetical protein
MYVESVEKLKRELYYMKMESDRREKKERKIRLKMEREISNERDREGGGGKHQPTYQHKNYQIN